MNSFLAFRVTVQCGSSEKTGALKLSAYAHSNCNVMIIRYNSLKSWRLLTHC